MTRIRAFEVRVARHFKEGQIPGFVHVSIGQEAVAAGVCGALGVEDFITTTHRGHGHCLAKGADAAAMMAELFARAGGTCAGKGGSMHIADPRLGILGANGIVGAGLPIAVGAALAARRRGGVAVAFAGEGTVHGGYFHEALTLAVLWGAPVVFVIENNHFAEFTDSDKMWRGAPLVERVRTYGVGSVERIDGNDVEEVRAAAESAVAVCREGRGPCLIEAMTYRIHGHYEGDAIAYRDPDEFDAWRAKDPIEAARRVLATDGLDAEVARLSAAADEEMDRAVELAFAAPYPETDEVLTDVYA
jgi:TPP-dependent pyruvate/acetoin dehydrogenase alpha subunit